MGREFSSILLGTTGLALAAIVALALACSRPGVAPEHVRRIRLVAGLAVGLQAVHFWEEYQGQFHLRFPAQFGLAPWSEQFFVSFNAAWLLVWSVALAALARHPRAAVFPLWFLAIASAANGLVHPVLSLRAGEYFPGLWTSPLVGILGAMTIVVLVRGTTGRTTAPRTR